MTTNTLLRSLTAQGRLTSAARMDPRVLHAHAHAHRWGAGKDLFDQIFITVSFIPLNMHASMNDMFLMYSTLINKSVIKDTISESLTSQDCWKHAAGENKDFIFTLLCSLIGGFNH